MPKVGNKKYPYTAAGKHKAIMDAMKKKSKGLDDPNRLHAKAKAPSWKDARQEAARLKAWEDLLKHRRKADQKTALDAGFEGGWGKPQSGQRQHMTAADKAEQFAKSKAQSHKGVERPSRVGGVNRRVLPRNRPVEIRSMDQKQREIAKVKERKKKEKEARARGVASLKAKKK
tara:strand:+ start:1904 stop:2422 length:519 start_codon:yes stop_codon:yes gene_type:complete